MNQERRKALGGRLSEHQAAFLKDIEQMGCLAVVARSVEDLQKIFKRQGLL